MHLDKHPILQKAHDLCQAIEECGASEKLTYAVALASTLGDNVEFLIDEHARVRNALEKDRNECMHILEDALGYGRNGSGEHTVITLAEEARSRILQFAKVSTPRLKPGACN